MNRKGKIVISIIGITTTILALIGFTYGFFVSKVYGNSSDEVVLEIGESQLTVHFFEESNEQHLITPGYIYYQMFTVTNTGNIEVAYQIFLENVVNEFERTNDITYSLYKMAYEGTVNANSNIFNYNNLSNCVEEPLDINENYANTCYLVSTNTFPTTKTSIANREIIKTPNYKYVYLLKYEYLNSEENQDIDKGHIFGGKVKVYGKDSGEAESPFDEGTLASKIIENAVNNLNGTIYSETPLTIPGQQKSSQKYEKNNNLIEVKTQSNITTTKTFTYASDYTERTSDGYFTLTNATSGVFSDIYESLPGKYVVSVTGADNEVSSENIANIYKVISTTSNSITYAGVSPYASDERILSKTEENGGYSYYYRGGVEDNYLNFNNMCWRIVRIDNTGGVKLILASQDGECSTNTLSYNSGYIKSNGSVVGSNFGYKSKTLLTPTGTNRTVTIQDFINSTSGAKKTIENWFINNNFDETKLKYTSWCLGNTIDAYNGSGVKYELTDAMVDGNGDQYATAQDYLLAKSAAYQYLLKKELNCNDENDTKYNSYVGLLTVDEVMFAGTTGVGNTPYAYYLHDNAITNYWWSLSLFQNNYNLDRIFCFGPGSGGNLNGVINNYALRPSIVLEPEIEYISGDGTLEHPYEVE